MTDGFTSALNTFFCSQDWQLPAPWYVDANSNTCISGIDILGDRIYGTHTCGSYTGGSQCYTGTQRSNNTCGPLNLWYVNNWRRTRSVSCPLGTSDDSYNVDGCGLTGVMPDKQQCCGVGWPIDPLTGNKQFAETDYVDGSPRGELTLRRNYNSLQTLTGGYPPWRAGKGWRHSFDRSVQVLGNATLTQAFVTRGDGRLLIFTLQQSTGQYIGDADAPEVFRNAPSGSTAAYQFVDTNDNVENYDADGHLLSIATRDGFVTTLSYDTYQRLSTVTSSSGRTLQFNYASTSDDTMSTVVLPDGQSIAYTMLSGKLTHVLYPDSSYVDYVYTQSTSQSGALLTDVSYNGVAYTHYTYGGSNGTLASSTSLGSSTAAIATFGNFQYTQSNSNVATSFTTPLGQSVTYSAQVMFQKAKLTSISAPCPLCGVGNIASQTYDTSGYLKTRNDFNGNVIQFTYDDTRGLETQRIEAYGTSSARTTNTIWDANFRVPDQRSLVNASSVTESQTKWTYNTRGQVLSRCEIDPAVSGALSYTCGSSTNAPTGVRQTTYTYCEQAAVTAGTCPLIGLVLTADGPRTDVSDVTTYAYYQTTDLSGCSTLGGACHSLGDLYKVTNALNQVTTYVSYDKNGRVTRQSDANGTLTDFTYHSRGWLLTRTIDAATTTFAYDNVGNVTRITQPDSSYLAYTYDAAHRLTDVTDNLGNTIHYTLDAAGNRTNETTKDPSGTLMRTLSRQYDQLNRLTKTLNAASVAVQTYQNPAEAPPTGVTYTNGYDGNGNAIYNVDSNGIGTEQQYDPLNRLVKTLQDHAGAGMTKDAATQYAYDARDNLRSVSDPDSLITNYTYDGLNNLTQLQSPDTGSSSYTYDAAGNRKTQTDARGITTTYTYDALNRLTSITYPTSSLNVTYAYDQANSTTGCTFSFPVGRLTTIADSTGTTRYCYDRRGNITSKTQTITNAGSGTTNLVQTTQIGYSSADRIVSITYPSGPTVSYVRDSAGRITSVSYKGKGFKSSVSIVNNATYYPFGPLNTITFGNGRTLSKSYDQDYAIDKVVSSDPNGLIVDATVDVLGNLTSASNAVGATSPTQSYLYDPLYRLTNSQTGGTPASPLETYTYNKTGDRTSAALNGAAATSYVYIAGTHRLQSTGGATRSYDANGNTQSANGTTFVYDDRNRLTSANGVTYVYNGKGERVGKSTASSATTFVFDERGQLIGEYTSSGSQEYVYLDTTLVGIVVGAVVGTSTTYKMYYVETDQLGTPRVAIQPGATTSADTMVWKWDYFGSAFGTHQPNPQTLTVNLRFAGQYYDAETGMVSNGYRDCYDPATGRYCESDPIGLDGGINSYTYVSDRPLTKIDPDGLIMLSGFFDSDSDTQSRIFNAASKVEKLLNSPCDCGGKSCYPCELRDELLRKFYTTEIQFNPVRSSEYRGRRFGVCATTPLRGSIISVTENGLLENHRGCSCFAGLILHELIHAAGVDHTTNDPKDPNEPVWGPVKKCNMCSAQPLPWEVL